jgi:hypothetical protein
MGLICEEITGTYRYFLTTWLDGNQMLGSDGTTVLKNIDNIENDVKNKIEILQRLSHNVKPYIKQAKSVVLKLEQAGVPPKTLKEFDVTKYFS